jgi:uncharacterized protein (DUF2336 family)
MTHPTPPGLEGLVDLACRDGVDIRPTLLRVLTDLYVQKPSHTAEEERHYVELAQRLFNTVDANTRAAVAARLMSYGHVPQALAGHLEIRAILPEVPVADAGAAEHAPNEKADNLKVEDEKFEDLPKQAAELTEIFFSAGAGERRLILTHLEAVAGSKSQPVKNARDVVKHLESAALRHDAGAFAREITGALGLDRELSRRIVHDPSGEPLLLVGKALDMPAAVVQRVLLFLNPTVGQSVQRVYELAALYEQFSTAAANYLLSIFRQGIPKNHPAYQSVLYQSVLWNDNAETAREAATPQKHVDTSRERDTHLASLPSPFSIGAR